MRLSILGLVDVRIDSHDGRLMTYIEHEYGPFVVKNRDDDVDLVIELAQDVTSPDRMAVVRPPVGFDERGVFFHDPTYHVLRLNFENFGARNYTITCDPEFNPHFFAIVFEYLVSHLMVDSGHVFCHSSAFRFRDRVVLCPAWRHVGKTNILLSFLLWGAEYIADDWSVLKENGTLRSLPKRLNLLYYNFREYDELLGDLDPQFVALFDFVRRAESGEYDVNEETLGHLKEQARLRLSAFDLFGSEPLLDAVPIDHVVFLERSLREDDRARMEPMRRDALTSSSAAILRFEQAYFDIAYIAYKGRGGHPNERLERAPVRAVEIMDKCFAHVQDVQHAVVPTQSDARSVATMLRDYLTGADS